MTTEAKPGDMLDLSFINSLPQPFMAQKWGNKDGEWLWPVHDIDVETGLLRIDVCGQLDVLSIGDVKRFQDASGTWHHSDDFYIDAERAQ